MQTYLVEIQRTITCEVEVKAYSAAQAAESVQGASFPLPPQSEWATLKDEEIIVRDEDGNEIDTVST